MTIVTPIAIKPTTEICLTTLNRFLGCRKESVRNVIPTNIAIKINTMAYFLINALNHSRLSVLPNMLGVVVLAMATLLLPLSRYLLLPSLSIQTVARSGLHDRLLRSIFTFKYTSYSTL